MQNSITDNSLNSKPNLLSENTLSRNDLLEIFHTGTKSEGELKIGMEYERIPVKKSDFSAVGYFGEKGIQNFLLEFAKRYNWEEIKDNTFIIGLKKNGVQISLEPGAQVEISTSQYKNVTELEKEIEIIEKQFDLLAIEYDIKLLSYGVSPVTTWKNIPLIPKTRYHLMNKMLSGYMAPVMMRETAGIQAAFDFTSEEDAIKKFSLALLLSPFATAIFANSPIRAGESTGYQSYRASAWLNTDSARCGLVSYKLFEQSFDNFDFSEYLNVVLNVPMLYIVRGDEYIKFNTYMTFDTFMKKGYEGYFAIKEDFDLHLNLYFPEVRLRNYIEVRNHDCVPGMMKYAVPTLYKGILYNENSANAIFELCKDLTYIDFVYLRENVPKYGLQTKVGRYKVIDFAKEILAASYNTLYKSNDADSKYLEQPINLIYQKKTMADLVIENREEYLL